MELTEPLDVINRRLLDHFGRFEDGRPLWQVVWSDDQREKLFIDGVLVDALKYNYIQHKYVLVRLMPVYGDLLDKTSYEPVWTFEDRNGNPLPPKWEACEFIIYKVLEAAAKATGAKYKMPESEYQTKEAIAERVARMEEMLYGNETPIGDALSVDSAVGYGVRKRDDNRFRKVN